MTPLTPLWKKFTRKKKPINLLNMTKTLRAFHGKQEVKDKYIERVQAHATADEIVKGKYWEDGKGCAVGCTIEGSDHERYETELGIPEQIAHIEDALFEELPNGTAKAFPLKFLEAIPVGADLSLVCAKLVVWQFEDEKYGLKHLKEVQEDKEVYGFCEEVVALYKRESAGDTPTQGEFRNLYEKIDRAWAWAGAGARTGAWARAWAGAWADYEKLKDEAITATSEQLLTLLREAPVKP